VRVPEGYLAMERPFHYRDLAARCVLMATDTSAPGQKAALLEMARRWAELADQVERSEIQVTNGNGMSRK
jgi:hypothetical protein